MKNKKLLYVLAALVTVIAIMLGVYLMSSPETAEGLKEFTVTVVHADGSTKEFTYTTEEEFLGACLLAEGLIAGPEEQYGLVIETVDGEDAIWAENGAYWSLYIGEEYATTGVDTTPVNDGDSFRLVYTVG